MTARLWFWIASLGARAILLWIGAAQFATWEARTWLPWLLQPSALGQRWLLSVAVLALCVVLVWFMPDWSLRVRGLVYAVVGALVAYWGWAFGGLSAYLWHAAIWPWCTDPRYTMARLGVTVLLVAALSAAGYVATRRAAGDGEKRVGEVAVR